jgi:SHS2 domain-containing protein
MGNTRFTAGTASPAMSPTHEVADHVSEIRLRMRAASLGELLAEAGRALGEIQLRGADATANGPWREVAISAADRPALLTDWLNELIYLAEAERWVGVDFEMECAEDSRVSARVWGVRVRRAPGLVKAATLHGVRVDEVPGGLEGEVVLDV